MKLIFTAGLLLMLQVTLAQGNTKKIDSLLNGLYTNGKLNGNVLIAEKGKVIYKKSFGKANEATNQNLDENSIFELASCSKQFTAMAIIMLKEKGKLNLNDNITKFIPELSHYKNITIKNLLQHTGGMPDYMELMDSVFDKSKIAVNRDIITLFKKHKPAILFAPNTKYEYSNTGYALLASVIEKASGQTYAAFLKANIFKPLQMTKSFVYTRRYKPLKINNYAFGYVYTDSLKEYKLPDESEETKMVIWLDGIVGDGCVNSTVNDLLKWDRALYTNKLISKKSLDEIFEPATLADKTQTKYGYGWGIENNKDFGKLVSHSGGWPGYISYIERHIENDKTIIILQNHNNVIIPAKKLRAILYNKLLEEPAVKKEITIPADELKKYTGTYEIQAGIELKITLDKEQLFAQLTGQNAFPIFPESRLLFFLKVVDAQIKFDEPENGVINKLTLLQNGNTIDAIRTQ